MTDPGIPAQSLRVALSAPARGGELDYLEIVTNTGPVVMLVLLILLAASAVSWGIIWIKWRQLRRAQDESIKFLEIFWQSKRLDAIYQAA
jgi:biopolymer transport protein TolQ